MNPLTTVLSAALLAGAAVSPALAQTGAPELTTPLGRAVHARPDADGAIARADQALAADPRNVDLMLAAARARDAVWQFGQALDIYTRALAIAPNDVRLLRFRGHRYISTRQYDRAVTDLEKAATLGPSSFDVLYHLGLAHYLRGEFGKAAQVYQRCLDTKTDPVPLPQGWRSCTTTRAQDNDRVAVSDWLYRALRRAGQRAEADALLATIGEGLKVGENEAYYATLRFYKGAIPESQLLDSAAGTQDNRLSTVGYGIANFHMVNGNTTRGCALLQQIVETPTWSAFGFLAAEADLVRTPSACPTR